MEQPRNNGRFGAKYNTAEELMAKIEEYFDTTEPKFQTRAGLCIFLGINKATFHHYKNSDKEGFADAIEWACTRLEAKYEYDLNTKANVTAPIFALKQYGWRENQDVEVKGSGSFNIISNIPRPEGN